MADGSIGSSNTSSSQTLTNPHSTMADGANPFQAFLDSIQRDNRHVFIRPTPDIPDASLNFVKATLDAFAGIVSDEQHAHIRELNKKRKRSEALIHKTEALKLRKVHVDELETSQIWQQAQKIITSSLEYSQDVLRELEEKNEIVVDSTHGSESDAEENEEEVSGGEYDSEEEYFEDDSRFADEFVGTEDDEEDAEGAEDEDEEMAGVLEEQNDRGDDEEDEEEETGSYTEDPFGLNDGFFNIDEFNRQTELFEKADAHGEVLDDSDEEKIDWNANPLAKPSQNSMSKRKSNSAEDDNGVKSSEDDEDDGPTFGNVDLFAPEGASEDENDDNYEDLDKEPEFNANEIYFKDFFAPPPKKRVPGAHKLRRASKPIVEEDIDRAMNDVKRDLFEDLSDNSDMEDDRDDLSDVDVGDPKSRRSVHERRQAKLAEEIRRLEAAAVEKRKWTLSGEAAASERPANSLLEEDLDFEYVGKPVPVITLEVTESIEDMIKRRILSREFDEVIRRRLDEHIGSDNRRGLVEIDDTKSKKGLAEIYEEEYIKNTNPDTYVSASDSKLAREEREVEEMWKRIVGRLDALSSWHYKPKPTEASLAVVSDVAIVAMEDVMPTTAAGVTADSVIAPQEVYSASAKAVAKGEVVTKGGMPLAKAELSRDDKARMRRREKERGGKRADLNAGFSKKQKEEKETIAELRKGGVKVVNRKGEVVDVDGKKIKGKQVVSSGNYKL